MAGEAMLTVGDIRETFEDMIQELGGKVSQCFDDGQRLFARSTMPAMRKVGRADGVKGGAALRADEKCIKVCPYVFRLVCRNGAIFVQAMESWSIEYMDRRDPREVLAELRDAVHACASPEAMVACVESMRLAHGFPVGTPAMWLMKIIGRRAIGPRSISAILARAEREERSRFGLMNAVTSLARDTRNPDLRWRLEELGGAIAVAAEDAPKPRPRRRAAALSGSAG